jgi:hypothetical protein
MWKVHVLTLAETRVQGVYVIFQSRFQASLSNNRWLLHGPSPSISGGVLTPPPPLLSGVFLALFTEGQNAPTQQWGRILTPPPPPPIVDKHNRYTATHSERLFRHARRHLAPPYQETTNKKRCVISRLEMCVLECWRRKDK